MKSWGAEDKNVCSLFKKAAEVSFQEAEMSLQAYPTF